MEKCLGNLHFTHRHTKTLSEGGVSGKVSCLWKFLQKRARRRTLHRHTTHSYIINQPIPCVVFYANRTPVTVCVCVHVFVVCYT